MGGSEKVLAMIYSREIRRILRTGKILAPVLVATKMIAANHSLWLTIFLTLLCFLCIMIIERNTLHALDYLDRGVYQQDGVGLKLILISIGCAFFGILVMLIVASENDVANSASILVLAMIVSWSSRILFG